MAFRFSLETLLRARVIRAEAEERKLLLLRREVGVLRQQMAATEELIGAHQTARLLSDGCLRYGREILLLSVEAEDLHQQFDRLLERCLNAETKERQQRTLYQSAEREKEVVLELKKRQRQLYERLLRRKEQKAADETFLSTRFRRS